MTGGPIIQVEGLKKTFFQGLLRKRVDAVRGVSFEVRSGEIFGFVGPNGSGKTTTIKMLTGLIQPSAGRASIFGHQVPSIEAMKRVGFLPESPYIYPYLTPREFVEMCGQLSGLSGQKLRDRAAEVMRLTGIEYAGERPVRRLSKGMGQRTALAAALVADPELLVLDEPMSGLDPVGRKEVRDIIIAERKAGRTIFFSTHILADVETICDRVTVLRQGEVVVSGALRELLRGDVLRTDVSLAGANDAVEAAMREAGHKTSRAAGLLIVEVEGSARVGEVLRASLDAGAQVVEVTPRRETLEDLFLRRAIGGDEQPANAGLSPNLQPRPRLEHVVLLASVGLPIAGRPKETRMARTRMPRLTAGLLGPLARATGTAGTVAAGSSLAWILYSRLFVDHAMPLRPAIGAERRGIDTDGAGHISYYASDRGKGRPLVLLHSINAAASSYEMMPLFERYHGIRPVFAVDLPGFGMSDRGDRDYSPDFYAEAIHYALRDIALSREPVDLVALSLTGELAALAALRTPELVRSLTLISPTGFGGGENQALLEELRERGLAKAAHLFLTFPLWSQSIYDALVTQRSIDYFLRKSFAGRVDEGLRDYAFEVAHQPGARHAPLAFLSGKLFTRDVRREVYAKLQVPVMVLYDRDAYTGFERLSSFISDHPTWQATLIPNTRGLPHFERPLETAQALESFWGPLGGEDESRSHA